VYIDTPKTIFQLRINIFKNAKAAHIKFVLLTQMRSKYFIIDTKEYSIS